MLVSYVRVDVNSWARVLTEATNTNDSTVSRFNMQVCNVHVYAFTFRTLFSEFGANTVHFMLPLLISFFCILLYSV